ncbi:MAG: ribose-phosphate pyrophosphokinase [Chloroflexi bacterium]|nr:ribose-phosphate pyrophosphokinase [Chloroflexota bacterium]
MSDTRKQYVVEHLWEDSLSRELSIFTGRAHPTLASAICQYLGVELGKAEVFEFSNENIFVKINQNVREHDVFVIQPTYPEVSRSILELLIMIDALKRASARRLTAVIPYYAYGRSDKKDQPRVPITARLLADIIQTAGADRVLTVDLHAGQVQGFFKIPVDELTAVYLLSEHFRQMELIDPVVVSADIGFAKKARNFAELVGAQLAIVEKRRVGNDSTSEQLRLIGDVAGRSAIVIDDEIDTAGSITGAVELVRREGARRIFASCVHPILSGGAVPRLRRTGIEELVTTDTVPLSAEKQSIHNVRVLSVAMLIGEAISRIHTGTSVGALFEHR